MKFLTVAVRVLISIISLSGSGFSQTYLDTSFADNGWFQLNYPLQVGSNESIAEGIDGGVITLSETGIFGAWTGNLIVRKYFPDGSQDLTFAESGEYWLDPSLNTHDGRLKIQNDGKILVAGGCSSSNFYRAFVCRLNSNGTLDESFGENGYFITPNDENLAYQVNDIDLQNDQKIVLGGYLVLPTGVSNGLIFRLNTNGTMDFSFGENGYFLDAYDIEVNRIERVIVDSEDAIVFAEISFGNLDHIHFGRVLPDGQEDELYYSFNQLAYGVDLTMDDQHRTYALCYLFNSGFTVIAMNSDGTPNLDFSDDGLLHLDVFNVYNMAANRIKFRPPNKLVIAGSYEIFEIIQNFRELLLLGLDNNGQIDFSFGENGIIGTSGDLIAGNDFVQDFYCQADEKIVVTTKRVTARFGMEPVFLETPEARIPIVSIGPIPTSGSLYINAEEGYKFVSILDATGRKYFSSAAFPNMSVDLSDLQPGLYLIKLEHQDGSSYLARILKN